MARIRHQRLVLVLIVVLVAGVVAVVVRSGGRKGITLNRGVIILPPGGTFKIRCVTATPTSTPRATPTVFPTVEPVSTLTATPERTRWP
jgi:hypothetical protein